MTDQPMSIEEVRERAGKWLSVTTLGFAVATLAFGLVLPAGTWVPGAVAFLFAAMAWFGSRQGSGFGRQLIGLGMIGQAMAFVSAFSGTAWQIDAHFSFLAFLALLVSLYDIKVIVVATVAIALHHLGFGLLFQSFVFPSLDIMENAMRAVFHAVLVVILDAGLIASIVTRMKMEALNATAIEDARQQSARAEEALAAAEEAATSAERGRVDAEQAEQQAKSLLAELKSTETARVEADAKAQGLAKEQDAERAHVAKERQVAMEALRNGLSRLAQCDFSQGIDQPLPEAFEALRTDYNVVVARLSQSFGGLTTDMNDLSAQVATINESAGGLATRTERQLGEIEKATSAVSDLSASVKDSSDHVNGTAAAMQAIHSSARAGSEVVGQAVSAMREIQVSANEIAKINALIDGIAFQTNLLALNAGVEAARAGEAGRGFAVVASEVRALAQRTTDAANNIGGLVERSQTEVQTGASLVEDAGQRLQGIVTEIDDVAATIKSIADVSRDQSSGLEQFNSTVNELDGFAQSNAAMLEETSAACTYLNDRMAKMKDEIASFQIGAPALSHTDQRQAG